jgi:hypothetical protein
MNKLFLMISAAWLLTACDKPASSEAVPPAASEIGRWTVVPIAMDKPIFRTSSLQPGTMSAHFFAWRIDTKNGQLEACTYETTPEREQLTCILERK